MNLGMLSRSESEVNFRPRIPRQLYVQLIKYVFREKWKWTSECSRTPNQRSTSIQGSPANSTFNASNMYVVKTENELQNALTLPIRGWLPSKDPPPTLLLRNQVSQMFYWIIFTLWFKNHAKYLCMGLSRNDQGEGRDIISGPPQYRFFKY